MRWYYVKKKNPQHYKARIRITERRARESCSVSHRHWLKRTVLEEKGERHRTSSENDISRNGDRTTYCTVRKHSFKSTVAKTYCKRRCSGS
jgi:hypothetical protein